MIISVKDPKFYSERTIEPGIKDMAATLGMENRSYRWEQKIEPYDGECIVIVEGYALRAPFPSSLKTSNIDDIKKMFPRGKIIALGSYSTHIDDYIEYDHPSKVDLHLDVSYNVANKFREQGIVSDMFLWSGTQSVYDHAEEWLENHNFTKQRDALCLARCPAGAVKKGGWFYDRRRLIAGLLNNKISVAASLELWVADKVFEEYAKSYVSLGTTTPSSDKERTGKGFRDWIAPFLGVVLIHDDYEGYVDLYKDIVPMYKYGDVFGCKQLIQELKADDDMRNHYIEKQKKFAIANTIEKQLMRAYNKYITKTETNPILQTINEYSTN